MEFSLVRRWQSRTTSPGKATPRDIQRFFFSLALALMAPALVFFAFGDLTAGRTTQALLTFLLAAVLGANLIFLRRLRRIEWPCRFSTALALVVLFYEMAVGGGGGHVFVWFYVLPLCVFFLLGREEGVLWVTVSGAAAAVFFFGELEGFHRYEPAVGLRFLLSYFIVSVLSYGLETSRSLYYERLEKEKEAVVEALAQVETLSGLLPMCASCKSVRDDKGYWNRIERYLSEHSLAALAHALCPQCGGDSTVQLRPLTKKVSETELGSGGLLAWVEGRFLARGLTGDERRRRGQFALLLILATPVVFAFAVEDLLAGRLLNGGVDLLLAGYLLASLFFMIRAADARPFFRVFAALVLTALSVELETGGGGGFAFLWIYCFPGILMVLLGHREGALWSATALLVSAVLLLGPVGHSYEIGLSSRFMITFAIIGLLCFGFESSTARSYGLLRNEKSALQSALDRVTTLRGMLPICPQCKKIRDDRGYWQEIEAYLGEQTGGSFSHGLCPDCLESFFSELDEGDVRAGSSLATPEVSQV